MTRYSAIAEKQTNKLYLLLTPIRSYKKHGNQVLQT